MTEFYNPYYGVKLGNSISARWQIPLSFRMNDILHRGQGADGLCFRARVRGRSTRRRLQKWIWRRSNPDPHPKQRRTSYIRRSGIVRIGQYSASPPARPSRGNGGRGRNRERRGGNARHVKRKRPPPKRKGQAVIPERTINYYYIIISAVAVAAFAVNRLRPSQNKNRKM